MRVIDLITNIDMSAFQTHQGLTSFISRLESEVNMCRKEQPFEIVIPGTSETQPEAEDVEPVDQTTPAPPENNTTWRDPNQDENTFNRLRETDDISEEPVPSSSEENSSALWPQPEGAPSTSSQKSSDPNQGSDFNDQGPSTSRNVCTDVSLAIFLRMCISFEIMVQFQLYFIFRSRWRRVKKTIRIGCRR